MGKNYEIGKIRKWVKMIWVKMRKWIKMKWGK